MNELVLIRELGSMGVLVFMLILTARYLEMQRRDFLTVIHEVVELITELCSKAER